MQTTLKEKHVYWKAGEIFDVSKVEKGRAFVVWNGLNYSLPVHKTTLTNPRKKTTHRNNPKIKIRFRPEDYLANPAPSLTKDMITYFWSAWNRLYFYKEVHTLDVKINSATKYTQIHFYIFVNGDYKNPLHLTWDRYSKSGHDYYLDENKEQRTKPVFWRTKKEYFYSACSSMCPELHQIEKQRLEDAEAAKKAARAAMLEERKEVLEAARKLSRKATNLYAAIRDKETPNYNQLLTILEKETAKVRKQLNEHFKK